MVLLQEDVDGAENDDADDMPEVQETVCVVPGSTLLWRIDSRPAHSAMVQKHTSENHEHHISHSNHEIRNGSFTCVSFMLVSWHQSFVSEKLLITISQSTKNVSQKIKMQLINC